MSGPAREAVDRLTKQMVTWPGQGVYAADLMRSLLARAENAEASARTTATLCCERDARIAALEAERDKLREALSLIAVVGFSDDPDVAKAIARQTVEQARAALAETEGRGDDANQ